MNIIMLYKENLSFPSTNFIHNRAQNFLGQNADNPVVKCHQWQEVIEMQLYLQVSERLSKQETILLDSFLSSHKHKNRRNGPHKF